MVASLETVTSVDTPFIIDALRNRLIEYEAGRVNMFVHTVVFTFDYDYSKHSNMFLI